MNNFFPFIYERKKKNSEPIPLYIEVPAPVKPQEEIEKKSEEEKVVIIELL